MATLFRVRCTWTGLNSGAGVTTHYFKTTIGSSDITALKTFWSTVTGVMPTGMAVTVPSTGDTLDDTTGALTGSWAQGAAGTLTGVNAGAYAAGVGCGINWFTGTVVGRRRLRGRTFVVPITGADFDTNGTLTGATVTALTNAAATLVTAAPSLCVWHRPKAGAGGASALVTSSSVDDRVRTLSSRR